MIETGTKVRVRDPDGYHVAVASKLRNRVGYVVGYTAFVGRPIVTFPAVGRRKEYQKVFYFTDLEIAE